jgi:hypothetical protein
MNFNLNHLVSIRQMPFLAVLIVTVCFAPCIRFYLVFGYLPRLIVEQETTRAKARAEVEER